MQSNPMVDQAASPGTVPNQTSEALPKIRASAAQSISWSTRWLSRSFELANQPAIILLLLVSIVVSHGISKGELFYYNDEMHHAMNGVLIRDLIVDHPWQHPLKYITEYYAKYPALAFPHWPPLFHVVEGVFFLLFGLSPGVSRFAVLCFALLAIFLWYRIAERFGPRYRAFLSALVLAAVPFVLLYERVTMLEVPALAGCLGAIYFWLRFLDSGKRRDLLALSAFVISAFLISQKAIFLVFFIGLDLLIEGRFRILRRFEVWLALLICALTLLPWYVLAARTMSTWITRVVGHSYGYLTSTSNYTFYPIKLYSQLGPFLIILAIIGAILIIQKRTRPHRFLLVWIVSGYICFTLISEKDPRHTMLWMPPVIYLALIGLETLLRKRALAVSACSVLAGVLVINGIRTTGPKLNGVEEVARYVLSLPNSDIVYYQGDLNGDFIFFVRKFDPQRTHMVAREKQVVVSRLGWRVKEVLHSDAEVLNFFETWGIRYAVIEDHDFLPGLDAVHELLGSDQFELLRTFPIVTSQANYPTHEVKVYRFRGELHRTKQAVDIPMLTIRHDISADLSRLVGRPWPN